MCSIISLIKHTFKDRTPFAKACACATVIGVADLIATGTDIYWLIGDMSIQTHPHHWPTMCGLVSAELLMCASFVWLIISLVMYIHKQDRKKAMKAARHRVAVAEEAAIPRIKHSEK